MNTLDDLRSSLDGYADRGDARGADALWAAATDPAPVVAPSAPSRPGGRPTGGPASRRLRILAGAAAVVLVLVATIAVVRSRSDEIGVITTPDPPVESVPRSLPPVTVADGTVRVVHVAFDRVWVGTGSDDGAPARLRSFDVGTGDLVTDVELAGPPTALAATDGGLWVRTDGYAGAVLDPAGVPSADMTLARVDPVTGQVTYSSPLSGDGPMAAHDSRIAVADRSRLTIIDDALDTVATATIAEAIGHDNTVATDTGPEPGGFAALTFGSAGLAGLYLFGPPGTPSTSRPTGELVTIQPETARHASTRLLDPNRAFSPFLTAAGGATWLSLERDLVRADAAATEPIGADPAQLVAINEFVVGLGSFGDRVLALTVSDVVVTGDGTTFRTPLDRFATGSLVEQDGLPWVAQWNQAEAAPGTTVSFVLVRTDADGPPTSFVTPTTEASPPSTVVAGGGPTLWKIAEDPMRDGVAYPIVGAGLPPGDAFLRVCLDQPATVGGDCWAPSALPNTISTVGDGGQLYVIWTAQRSVYDDRWHDCAVETCSLRLLASNEAGGVDLDRELARTPLRFSADTPPIRPTIALDVEGPITVGTKGLISGDRFTPSTKGISVGRCRSGEQDGSCRLDLAGGVNVVADEQGRFTVTYAILSSTITVPSSDGTPAEQIDCTVPGACSFSVFLDDSSKEPYATLPLVIAP